MLSEAIVKKIMYLLFILNISLQWFFENIYVLKLTNAC